MIGDGLPTGGTCLYVGGIIAAKTLFTGGDGLWAPWRERRRKEWG